ncbi:MAG: hypothetical protein M3198_16450 [Actinomycetota bacterium]|nr:hypothetical protein [Actinomycetota bacterium]
MNRKLCSFLVVGALAGLQLAALSSPAHAGNPCFLDEATKVGTNGHDVLRGTPGRDVIKGGAGNDTIFGFKRGDVLCGGPGNDNIYGGPGPDYLNGDTVPTGAGNDNLYGGPGYDTLNTYDYLEDNDWADGGADGGDCFIDNHDEYFNCLLYT